MLLQPQQHDFNLPYQLSHPRLFPDTDIAESADRYTFDVAPGDVIVAGSDGLFDNMWDDEMLNVIHDTLGTRDMSAATASESHVTLTRHGSADVINHKKNPMAAAVSAAKAAFARSASTGLAGLGRHSRNASNASAVDALVSTNSIDQSSVFTTSDAQRAAEALANRAFENAQDKEYKSPWSVAAGKNYGLLARLFAKGGKMDDITVVVAIVQDASKVSL